MMENRPDRYNAKCILFPGVGREFIVYEHSQYRSTGSTSLTDTSSLRSSKVVNEDNKLFADNRAASILRRIILSNNLRYHWRLSYAADITDREEVFRDLYNFRRRLWRLCDARVPVVGVLEISEERAKKNGGIPVIHVHLALDRWVGHRSMTDCWGHGFVFVSKWSKDIWKIAAYLSKYMRKDCEEGLRGKNQHRYFRGGDLAKWRESKVELTEIELEQFRKYASFSKNFDNGYVRSFFHSKKVEVQTMVKIDRDGFVEFFVFNQESEFAGKLVKGYTENYVVLRMNVKNMSQMSAWFIEQAQANIASSQYQRWLNNAAVTTRDLRSVLLSTGRIAPEGYYSHRQLLAMMSGRVLSHRAAQDRRKFSIEVK